MQLLGVAVSLAKIKLKIPEFSLRTATDFMRSDHGNPFLSGLDLVMPMGKRFPANKQPPKEAPSQKLYMGKDKTLLEAFNPIMEEFHHKAHSLAIAKDILRRIEIRRLEEISKQEDHDTRIRELQKAMAEFFFAQVAKRRSLQEKKIEMGNERFLAQILANQNARNEYIDKRSRKSHQVGEKALAKFYELRDQIEQAAYFAAEARIKRRLDLLNAEPHIQVKLIEEMLKHGDMSSGKVIDITDMMAASALATNYIPAFSGTPNGQSGSKPQGSSQVNSTPKVKL